jgi:hypothetical protein
MPVDIDLSDSSLVRVRASGRLTRNDYQAFVPQIEQAIAEHGKLRLLFEMRDFHGWDAGASWEDIKFGGRHFRDLERVAMVGDKTWEKWMAKLCRPFTTAEVRYFEKTDVAETWLEGPVGLRPLVWPWLAGSAVALVAGGFLAGRAWCASGREMIEPKE